MLSNHEFSTLAKSATALVAAIILSLGESAKAAPIIIDQAYLPTSTTTGTTSDEGSNAVFVGDTGLNASYAFDSRQSFTQLESGTATLSGTVALGGNMVTMSSSVSGAASANDFLSIVSWYNNLGGSSNLLGNGTPVPNDTLVIDVDAISTSGPGSVTLKSFALDSDFNRIEYTLGLTSNLYEIPFNDGGWVFMTGTSFNWGSVLELGVQLQSSSASLSNRSASVSIGTVSVVPEPSACVIAIAGLAGGCFLVGRRKRLS